VTFSLHKELLWGFFFNARHLVRRYGEIHVTHKTGLPYDRWDLEHLASGSSLAMVEKVPFQKEDYPGYNQKRGDGARCDEPFDLGACCTFKFQIGDLKKLKKRNGKRPGSIPSLGGSNIHPGNWTTDRGPFHHLPPFESRPWQHFPQPDNTGRMLMPPPPYIADQRPQPCFPPNSDGMVRAPYFHQHDSFHPTASMPGPWLNALPDQGGIHQQDSFQPMVSMPGPWLNALPDQGGIDQQDSFHTMASMPGPWLNALPPPGGVPPPIGRTPWPDLAPQEQHWYQQRTSLNHPAFLEHRRRDRESVQEWLRRMIAMYGRP
jgi:25S rRNA (uracil2634-N3)-methyltransferase